MKQKKSNRTKSPSPIVNRRARFDYELGDDIVTGIVLTGPEVRAARDGHIQLKGAYVTIRDGELWLSGASFSLRLNERGQPGSRTVDDSPRKLLASRRQIDQLAAQRQAGMTIVPTKFLTAGRHIKLVIALGKGRRRYDKRQVLKKRVTERDTRAALRQR